MMLTASMVRMIKGAAASIILLLMTEPRGGNQEWLERYTGYTDKPISNALSFLLENGMIFKTGDRGEYSYRLAGGITQLPLSPDLLGDGLKDEPTPDDSNPVDVLEIAPVAAVDKIESEIFRLDPLASRSNQNLEPGINPLARDPGQSEIFRLNLAAIDQFGIREPARTRLAKLKHVTPRLVQYHCAHADKLGQAIFRIEHNWKVPADWEPMDFSRGGTRPPEPKPIAPPLDAVPEQIRAEWGAAIAGLAGELNRAEFETWVRCITLIGLDAGELVIGANNPFAVDWLEQHVKRRLDERLGLEVRFEVRHESTQG